MTTEEKRPPWYQRVSGVAAAITGVVTAIGAVVAFAISYGPWGDDSDDKDDKDKRGSSNSGRTLTWEEVDAVLSRIDGTEITARGSTLRFCLFTNAYVALSTGQQVMFEKMDSLEVLRADPPGTSGGQMDVHVVLTSGDEIDAAADNCQFVAESDAGTVRIEPEDLERIDFER